MKLKSRKIEKYTGKVYDLTVDDTHTYNVERLAVHNSAPASLICYLNGLTGLDPIKHNLMFERFINPSRKELPDIDTDFQDTDRVREMLRDMYGEDNVACISTYNTFNIKGLLKDVGRVYGIPHGDINRANKKIEAEMTVLYKGQDKSTIVITVDDIIGCSPTYNNLIKQFPDVGRHVKMLYGKNRHIGRHACGVIVGDNLPREMPVYKTKGVLQTSYTMGIINKNVETMGFVKLDLLGLSTLSIIDHTLKLISSRHDMTYKEADNMIDELNLDLDDKKVLDTVFCDGNLTGIFQFSSSGIRKLALKVQPDCFNDVSAICSLYRPGPLGSGMDKMYATNKAAPDSIIYMHPLIEDVLTETYGCLIYQEQMLSIGHLVGKLSHVDTNRLRKLFLKKDKSKKGDFLDKEEKYLSSEFYKGCTENGMTKDDAKELWTNLRYFSGYGFNCLSGDTLVDLSKNGITPTKIIDCRPGDVIISRNESTGKKIKVKIKNVWDTGEKEIFEFKLDNGEIVKCTMKHKFRVKGGKMLSIREIIDLDLDIVSSNEKCRICLKTGIRNLDGHMRSCIKINTCAGVGCSWKTSEPGKTVQAADLKIHQKNCKKYIKFKHDAGRAWFSNSTPEQILKWRKNVGEAVSRGILASPYALRIRSEGRTRYNKSSYGRKISSQAAIKTSARPEIQAKRAKVLKDWRDNNPDKFAHFVMKSASRFKSIPESCLFNEISRYFPTMKQNQSVKSSDFLTKTNRRQCDILEREMKVSIEFDGPYHFKDIGKSKVFHRKAKDDRFNKVMLKMGYTVIRVSHDMFSSRKVDGGFTTETIDDIVSIIENRSIPSLYKIGGLYD